MTSATSTSLNLHDNNRSCDVFHLRLRFESEDILEETARMQQPTSRGCCNAWSQSGQQTKAQGIMVICNAKEVQAEHKTSLFCLVCLLYTNQKKRMREYLSHSWHAEYCDRAALSSTTVAFALSARNSSKSWGMRFTRSHLQRILVSVMAVPAITKQNRHSTTL